MSNSLDVFQQFINNEYSFYYWLKRASDYEEKGERIPRALKLRLRNLSEKLGIDIPSCPIKDIL